MGAGRHVVALTVGVFVQLYVSHLITDTQGFVPAEILLAKPGDIIEMTRLLYRHFGLYVGNSEVVHIQFVPNTLDITQGIIVKTNLSEEGAAGHYFRVNNLEDEAALLGRRARPTKDVVKDALEMVGQIIPYHVVMDNCEHVATGWKYGLGFSVQVITVFLQPSLLVENLFRYITGAHPIVLHRFLLFVVPFIIYLMILWHGPELAKDVVERSKDWVSTVISTIIKVYVNQNVSVRDGSKLELNISAADFHGGTPALPGVNGADDLLAERFSELQNQAIASLKTKIVNLESEHELLKRRLAKMERILHRNDRQPEQLGEESETEESEIEESTTRRRIKRK